jgi:hypothetical protein
MKGDAMSSKFHLTAVVKVATSWKDEPPEDGHQKHFPKPLPATRLAVAPPQGDETPHLRFGGALRPSIDRLKQTEKRYTNNISILTNHNIILLHHVMIPS